MDNLTDWCHEDGVSRMQAIVEGGPLDGTIVETEPYVQFLLLPVVRHPGQPAGQFRYELNTRRYPDGRTEFVYLPVEEER